MQQPLRTLGLGVLFALLTLPATAQTRPESDVPRVTRTFAIENARIVQAPGKVIERGTVVVRDGRILAVGANATIPFDAERIAGDSLVVYAGFIDALGHAGIAPPKREGTLPRVDDPANPPDDRAGRQPERHATTLLKSDDSSIDALRKAGFTLAHTVPQDGFLPGQGALVFLTDRDDARQMVLRDQTSLFAQFENARGVYPGTPMGIMAAWRDLYRESQRRQKLDADYAKGPAGRDRPPFDPVHEALFPVIGKTTPVFFQTDDALEAYRALKLGEELGFTLVLAGNAQAYTMLDKLKNADVPLVLTLELPEAPKGSAKKDSTMAKADSATTVAPDPPNTFFVSDRRTVSYKDIEGEKTNLDARSALVRKDYYATAARLDSVGLPFAFSTLDVKPADVHKNLRLMVENGLSEDAALAALTTRAAELLGIARDFGTVETGKVANLVITDKPFFDEKAAVRYVFVEGERYTYEKPKPKKNGAANGAAATATAVGTWSVDIPTPQGTTSGTLTITGEAGALGGTLFVDMMGGTATLENVEQGGSTLTFSFDAGEFGRIAATATIDGDALEGTLDVPSVGPLPFSGTRVP